MKRNSISIRTLSLLLSLLFVLTLIPVSATAASYDYTLDVNGSETIRAETIEYSSVYSYSWTSSNKCVEIGTTKASFSDGVSAEILGKSSGEATITLTASSLFGGKQTESWTVKVGAGDNSASITLEQESVTVNAGSTETVFAEAKGCTVQAASSDESVASVTVEDGALVIKGIAPGTAVISVTGKAQSGYSDPEKQEITVTVQKPEIPEHEKSITGSGDDYTLHLNVTAQDQKASSGSSAPSDPDTSKADILLIIDQSYSMYDKDKTSTDYYGNARTKSESVSRALISKSMWSVDGGILYTLSQNVDSWRVAAVSFSDNAQDKFGWSEDLDEIYSGVWSIDGQYGNETNIAAGLEKGSEVLKSARSDARKIVVFLSDGEPNVRADGTVGGGSYDDEAADDALKAAEKMKGMYDDFYVIGYAYKETGAKFLEDLTATVGGELTSADGIAAVEEKLAEIEERAEEPLPPAKPVPMSGVVITDTLSENVELSETEAANKYGVTVKPSDTEFKVDVQDKTVKVSLQGDLEDGTVYTVNIPVKPTKQAQDAANQAENVTTELPTNSGATLTYQYGDDPAVTAEYKELPVIALEKEFYLHHSSDNSIETIKWSDLKDGKIDVTKHIKGTAFYGGLFTDASYTKPSTMPGTELAPQGGATYYMREVPDTYLVVRMEHIYTNNDRVDENCRSTYAVTNVDSDQYYQKVGLEYSDPNKNDLVTDTVYKNLRVITSTQTFDNSTRDIYGAEGDGWMAVDPYNLRRNHISGTVTSFWITQDGVKVYGYTRTLDDGLRAKDVEDARAETAYAPFTPSEDKLNGQERITIREEEDEGEEDAQAKVVGYTLSLKGNIALNFYMELGEKEAQDENAYVKFTMPGSNHTEDTVYVSTARTVQQSGKLRHVFPVGVAAKDMTGEITAQYIGGDGVKSDIYPATVQMYCNKIIENAASSGGKYDDTTVTLAKSILNYGGYSQVHFNHKTDDLANKPLSDTDKQLPDVDASTIDAPGKSGTCTGLKYSGTTAMLTSTTGLRHYFKIDGDSSDYTFTAKGRELTPDSGSYGTFVLIDDIWARDLGNPVELTVTNKADGSSFKLSYSVFNYVKQVLQSKKTSEASKNMAKSLYAYNKAAIEYFEVHQSD